MLAAGFVGLYYGATSFASQADEAPAAPATARPVPVEIAVAEKSAFYMRHREYTGVIREARKSLLSFQVGGEIEEILFDEGDRVEHGQLIARLDDRHIRARLAQLEAEHAEAAAVLAELIAGPRVEAIASKRAELRQLVAMRDDIAHKLERREQLLRSASVSEEEVQSYRYELDSSRARADAVARQLDELVAGTRKEKITAQRARLARLDASITEVAHDLEDTLLKAPYSGRISQRMIDEGTVLAVGTPIAEMIDDTRLEAWVGLPASETSELKAGSPYEVSCGGRNLPAVLRSLSPLLDDATRTRNVILDLKSSAATGLLPGQIVRFAAEQRVDEPGFWVPTTALVRGTRGLWSVYAVEDSADRQMLARRDVEVLDTVGGRSYVRGTLMPGDRVVVDGSHRVVAGQSVVISPARVADVSKN
ncbi:MAG: efflux RND transporter periplasmic adaptor subunit [Planctomycetota bacterium]